MLYFSFLFASHYFWGLKENLVFCYTVICSISVSPQKDQSKWITAGKCECLWVSFSVSSSIFKMVKHERGRNELHSAEILLGAPVKWISHLEILISQWSYYFALCVRFCFDGISNIFMWHSLKWRNHNRCYNRAVNFSNFLLKHKWVVDEFLWEGGRSL